MLESAQLCNTVVKSRSVVMAIFSLLPAPDQTLGSWEISPEQLHRGMER